MKIYLLTFFSFLQFGMSIHGQKNNIIRGEIRFLNSGKRPVVGVEVSGTTNFLEKANKVYSSNKGNFELIFPKNRDGFNVKIEVGEKDAIGDTIEVVNDKEIKSFNFPAKPSNALKIVVCKKGERDLIAQQYYRIIKISSNKVLTNSQNELNELLEQDPLDSKKINELIIYISKIRKQLDSVSLYKKAFLLASKNKDDANKRTKKYLEKLGNGTSVQEAIRELDIQKASSELGSNFDKTITSINELEYYAQGNASIFKYDIASKCYNIIINELEKRKDYSNPSMIANLYSEASLVLNEMGSYNKALDYQQEAIKIKEKISSKKDIQLAILYGNIAITYNYLRNHNKALEYDKKAIWIREETQQDNKDLSTLSICYNNIATTYENKDDHENALKYLNKSIKIKEKLLKEKDISLAFSYDNIAMVYRNTKDYPKALYYHLKAINVREQILNPENPNLGISYCNIAGTYNDIGDFDNALKYFLKGIQIQEKILHEKHPSLANSYSSIAEVYKNIDDSQSALGYMKKAISIYEKIEHLKYPLAICYENIALLYRNKKDYLNALKFQKLSLNVLEELLGLYHPHLVITNKVLAIIYIHLNNNTEALKYLERCIKIQKKISDFNDPDLINSYIAIALVYARLNMNSKTLEYQQKISGILNEGHPNQIFLLTEISKIYYNRSLELLDVKDYKKALKSLIFLKEYNGNGNIYNYIGLCYYNLSDYSRAIQEYKKSISISPELKEEGFYNNIGLAYSKNKQYKEAEEAFRNYQNLYPKQGRSYRNWAMYYSLQNEKEKAITNLKKALDLGYNDLEWLRTDNSMNNIRKEIEFQKMISELKEKQN